MFFTTKYVPRDVKSLAYLVHVYETELEKLKTYATCRPSLL